MDTTFSRIVFLSGSYPNSRPNNTNKLHLLNRKFSALLPTRIIYVIFKNREKNRNWKSYLIDTIVFEKRGVLLQKKCQFTCIFRVIRSKFIGLQCRNHGIIAKQFVYSATKSNINDTFRRKNNISSPVARQKYHFLSIFSNFFLKLFKLPN